ncbi:MAG: hypothetical protein QXG39_06300 [Candidatus Aenigmatarchaeota archaeon]
MTTVTCPHCGYKQALREKTVEKIKWFGKRRLKCSKCSRYFFAYISQPKT